MITVRLFASLKDLAGRDELRLDIRRPLSLKGLWETLQPEIPKVVEWIRDKRVLVAVNHEMTTEETVIRDGDEVGLMPPFSGGEAASLDAPKSFSKPWTRIQAEDFSLDEELRRVKAVSNRIGGVAVFIGTARDFSRGHRVDRLRYEHYPGLAERTLAEIRERALRQFEIIEVCMIHRSGEVPVGGNIVLVIAAAQHRAEAFLACRWCIDELKATAPIWKKEITSMGDVWVEDRP